MGVGEDLSLGDKISVTVIATGFPTDEQVYTGKEEEKVFHTLVEEQSITKTLSPETPFPVRVRRMQDEDLEDEQEVQSEGNSENEVKFFLEEEEEIIEEQTIAEVVESDFVVETREISEEEVAEKNEEVQKEAPSQTIMFTLDDDFEDENIGFSNSNTSVSQEVVQPQVKEEVQISVQDEDPFDSPISHSLSQAIEERRTRLKQFNYKFKNTLSNKTVDDLENVPAYKRQGLELQGKESNPPSDYILSKDSNGDQKMRPNNFLHDNVD